MKKRGQTGTEYLIIVGFITFAVMAIVVIAFSFSSTTKDRLQQNQLEAFMNQLINSAESIFFSGEPSRAPVSLYLPDGVENITVFSDSIYVELRVSSGINKRTFDSNVPLNGTIALGEGTKNLVLVAHDTFVDIRAQN